LSTRHSREGGNPERVRPTTLVVHPSFSRRRESRESSPDNSRCPPVIPAKAGIQNALGALLKTFLQPLESLLDGPERPDHDGAGKLKILNDFSMGNSKEQFRCSGMENMDEMTIPFLP
jgi:hypothetical protein